MLTPVKRKPGLRSSGAIPSQVINADSLPDSALLSIPAVERLLDITASTVWRWSRLGILTPIRIGGVDLISKG